jgi:acetyl-CoA synthetase
MDEDGYFWFIGRDDDVIKSSGYRIGRSRSRARSWSTPPSRSRRWSGRLIHQGMIVKAFIVLKPATSPPSRWSGTSGTRPEHHRTIQVPRTIEFVSDPEDLIGKIQRGVLREQEMRSTRTGTDISAHLF